MDCQADLRGPGGSRRTRTKRTQEDPESQGGNLKDYWGGSAPPHTSSRSGLWPHVAKERQ